MFDCRTDTCGRDVLELQLKRILAERARLRAEAAAAAAAADAASALQSDSFDGEFDNSMLDTRASVDSL